MKPKPVYRGTIVRHIHENNPLFTGTEASNAFDAVTSTLVTLLQANHTLVIPNLGTFTPYEGKPRKGRSPHNPTVELLIPAKRRVKFKVHPELLNP